jgi:hypothetical protein
MNTNALDLHDTATRVAIAYLYAFVLAALDHIERVTGRRDYENYEPVWPEDEVVQQLWRASSEQASKMASDDDLIRCLRASSLLPLAENYAEQLLAKCHADYSRR